MSNKVIMQFFEWYLPVDARHWNRLTKEAAYLAHLGITDVWMPPAYKGQAGLEDVGYGVYDLYDLGEFYQRGTIPTKYGTVDEYLHAIETLHSFGIRAIGDIVLNHRMGEDYQEYVYTTRKDPVDRYIPIHEHKLVLAGTGFNFPGRKRKYSSFCWNKEHFTACDRNGINDQDGIFLFEGEKWEDEVDAENGNYDYLMGANVKFKSPEVSDELCSWGRWYMDKAKLDGVRLDAVKHIPRSFFPRWLQTIREHTHKEMFAVGEYWNGNPDTLTYYLDKIGHCMSLFDVALHYRLHQFAEAVNKNEPYDLRTIFDNTLVAREPEYAVTFVDNHDTQYEQPLESWVDDWFKPMAYALILLRDKGTPCVFYGDLYGIDYHGKKPVAELEPMLLARRRFARGNQHEHFVNENVIGWSRDGGLAVLMSVAGEYTQPMYVAHPNQVFIDLTGNCKDEIRTNGDGWGDFKVNPRSVSVWVPKDKSDFNRKT